MTLQDFKDQVAREEGHLKGWNYLVQYCIIMGEDKEPYIDRAAELYAKEREKEAFNAGWESA